MKILFISMPSIHAIRWTKQLVGKDCDLYWFDILQRGHADFHEDVTQITNWKKNKVPFIGKTILKKSIPSLYNAIEDKIEVTAVAFLQRWIDKNKPDVIHSFEMQHCTLPLLKLIKQHKSCPWVYSCWGSDLFYYQKEEEQSTRIKDILKYISHIHTDCKRDYNLAVTLGFKGEFFGKFPGGGGYAINSVAQYVTPVAERNIIVVKGYQHTMGRAVEVLKAMEHIPQVIKGKELIVFSAHDTVVEKAKDLVGLFKKVTVYPRNEKLSHTKMMKMMGSGIIYIGNSISDGMPNTLLEAIIMGAFPIQSNPGGVTTEVIDDGINGLLIEEPENPIYIAAKIKQALESQDLITDAFKINQANKSQWDVSEIANNVHRAYLNCVEH